VGGFGGFFFDVFWEPDFFGKGPLGIRHFDVQHLVLGGHVEVFFCDAGKFGDYADFVLEVDDFDERFALVRDFALADVAEVFDAGFSVGADVHGETVDQGLAGFGVGLSEAVAYEFVEHGMELFHVGKRVVVVVEE